MVFIYTLLFFWTVPGLFFFIFVFSIMFKVHLKFVDDWIRTLYTLLFTSIFVVQREKQMC